MFCQKISQLHKVMTYVPNNRITYVLTSFYSKHQLKIWNLRSCLVCKVFITHYSILITHHLLLLGPIPFLLIWLCFAVLLSIAHNSKKWVFFFFFFIYLKKNELEWVKMKTIFRSFKIMSYEIWWQSCNSLKPSGSHPYV